MWATALPILADEELGGVGRERSHYRRYLQSLNRSPEDDPDISGERGTLRSIRQGPGNAPRCGAH